MPPVGLLCVIALALGAPPTAAQQPGQEGQAEAMLPDLTQIVPRGLRVVETTRTHRFRLGFQSSVENAGRGPLTIVGRRPSRAVREMTATQIVRLSDGGSFERPDVGRLVYVRHRDHQHWHFLGFERYSLVSVGGETRRRDHKTGFCLLDRYDVDFFERGPFEPEGPVYERQCGKGKPGRLSVEEGISVGYGDYYGAHLEGQYIDVTGLPAGSYDLTHAVNVDGKLAESRAENNASSARLKLSWPNGSRRLPRIVVKRSCPGRAVCGSGAGR